MDLLVVAKEPRPGAAKTRLCPPCTLEQAAQVAAAALADTLAAAVASGADRVVLALDGAPGEWCPAGVDLVAQGDGDLGARLAQAWACTDGPGLQIGMDTPQLRPRDLDRAMGQLLEPETDAVLGPAVDGGWWGLGLRAPVTGAFDGVPMSTSRTGDRQLARLRELGLRTTTLPTLRDIDTWPDATHVATEAPWSHTARAVARVEAWLVR